MTHQRLGTFAAGALLWLTAAAAAAQTVPAAQPPAASAGSPQERAGFVKSVQGAAYVTGASGARRALQSGDAVGAAERIETDADSGASVVLRDGTMLVVGPSSQLDLKQFSFDATTQDGNLFVSLLRGSMRMVTGLLSKKPESVRIDTQTATIGIRGTDFIVEADASKS